MGVWHFQNSDENGVGGIWARYFENANDSHSFDAGREEYLVVCENEEQAKKLAKCMRSDMTPEEFGEVICLEGYEGTHYFENCIRSLQELEKSLEQILDAVCKPGVANLDYYDFRQIAHGTENDIVSFSGNHTQVTEALKGFFQGREVGRCMINLTGDFTLADMGDIDDALGGYEDCLIGAIPEESGEGMQVMVICN